MKVALVVLLFCITVLSWSRADAQTSTKQQFARLQARVDSEIQSIIAAEPNGEYLARHCESFERWSLLKALGNLNVTTEEYVTLRHGNDTPAATTTGDPAKPYTSESDLSNDPFNQDETSVAVSRKDPRLIVVGSNDEFMYSRDMRVYVTSNGGKSWDGSRLPRTRYAQYQQAGDPMLAADAEGRIYYTFLLTAINGNPTNLIVANSTDGINWTYGNLLLPVGNVDGFTDKETIAVDRDRASPHFGRVYLAWMHYSTTFSADSSGLKLAWSDDHGMTWTMPKFITKGQCAFSQLAVGKQGTLILSYSDYLSGTGYSGWHNFLVSTDGGLHFSEKKLSPYSDYPSNATGWNALKGLNGFRAFPYLSIGVEESTNRIHAVYGTLDNASHRGKLLVTYSDDLATIWSHPETITTSGNYNGDCFSPTIAVDQKTGESFVGFYASQVDSGNVNSTFVRGSLIGKGTTAITQLDPKPFNPLECELSGNIPFIGDYTGSDANASTYAVAWTEVGPFGGDGEVFVYVSSPQAGVQQHSISSPQLIVSPPSSNPVGEASTKLSYRLGSPSRVVIELINVRGESVRSLLDRTESAGAHAISANFSGLAAGAYFFRIRTQSELHTEPIIHVR